MLIVAVLWFLLLWVPEWMVNQYQGGPLARLDYTKAVDDYRKTLAQILGGLALLVGLYFTWRTTRQLKTDESPTDSARLSSNLVPGTATGASKSSLGSEESMR